MSLTPNHQSDFGKGHDPHTLWQPPFLLSQTLPALQHTARTVRSPGPGFWRTVVSCGHPPDWGPAREALTGEGEDEVLSNGALVSAPTVAPAALPGLGGG